MTTQLIISISLTLKTSINRAIPPNQSGKKLRKSWNDWWRRDQTNFDKKMDGQKKQSIGEQTGRKVHTQKDTCNWMVALSSYLHYFRFYMLICAVSRSYCAPVLIISLIFQPSFYLFCASLIRKPLYFNCVRSFQCRFLIKNWTVHQMRFFLNAAKNLICILPFKLKT